MRAARTSRHPTRGSPSIHVPEVVLVARPRRLLRGRARPVLDADDLDELLQIPRLLLPVRLRPEVDERAGEDGIVEAPGDPGGVVDHPQTAQRLDEAEGAVIEVAQLLVAVEEGVAKAGRLGVAPGEEEPEIL